MPDGTRYRDEDGRIYEVAEEVCYVVECINPDGDCCEDVGDTYSSRRGAQGFLDHFAERNGLEVVEP